jgi:hypothetical protein
MPIPPNSQRLPRRVPGTEEGSFYVDSRNMSSEKMDHRGPFIGTLIPVSGQVQVPNSSTSGDVTLVAFDARLWLPITSGAKARSVVTNVASNVSYSVVYAPQWGDQVECFVVRRTPS